MSWLRRNGAALIALLILVPVSVAVAVRAGESEEVIPSPTVRLATDSEGVAEYGGVSFQVTDALVLDESAPVLLDADVQLPPGTQLVVVRLDVEPDAGAPAEERILGCDVELVAGEDAQLAGTSWASGAAGRLNLLRDGDYPRDSCDLSSPELLATQWTFLTPVQPIAGMALRLTSYAELPDYLWLPLPTQ